MNTHTMIDWLKLSAAERYDIAQQARISGMSAPELARMYVNCSVNSVYRQWNKDRRPGGEKRKVHYVRSTFSADGEKSIRGRMFSGEHARAKAAVDRLLQVHPPGTIIDHGDRYGFPVYVDRNGVSLRHLSILSSPTVSFLPG